MANESSGPAELVGLRVLAEFLRIAAGRECLTGEGPLAAHTARLSLIPPGATIHAAHASAFWDGVSSALEAAMDSEALARLRDMAVRQRALLVDS